MKLIDISKGNSAITGYTTNLAEENFLNYLNEHLEKDTIENLILWLKEKKIYDFALLKNIWVDEEDRGTGVGTSLLQDFLMASKDLPVVLVCDNLESQNEGFKLEAWYEGYGFESTGFRTLSGPILIRY